MHGVLWCAYFFNSTAFNIEGIYLLINYDFAVKTPKNLCHSVWMVADNIIGGIALNFIIAALVS